MNVIGLISRQSISSILISAGLLTGCSGIITPTPKATSSLFRSTEYHLQVELPAGWHGTDRAGLVNMKQTALVDFNSWGEPKFYRSYIETPAPLPEDGVYIVLLAYGSEFVSRGDFYGEEFSSSRIADLWPDQNSWCEALPTNHVNDFFKWGRWSRIEITCGSKTSSSTVKQVNSLLKSWQFDRVPAGDPIWAWIEARKLLPERVSPERFPPVNGSIWSGDQTTRMTQTETIQANTVLVKFTLFWETPLNPSDPRVCSRDRCHWWQIEARPDGQIVLMAEGGADIPASNPKE